MFLICRIRKNCYIYISNPKFTERNRSRIRIKKYSSVRDNTRVDLTVRERQVSFEPFVGWINLSRVKRVTFEQSG
jgi:hypothetical protein